MAIIHIILLFFIRIKIFLRTRYYSPNRTENFNAVVRKFSLKTN